MENQVGERAKGAAESQGGGATRNGVGLWKSGNKRLEERRKRADGHDTHWSHIHSKKSRP